MPKVRNHLWFGDVGLWTLDFGLSYLTSTVAPASASFCLIVSASSLETASFTGFGAASTRSLASFKPSAVTSRTTLMTLILLPPTACRITSNSVFSSAGAAASPPPPPAAGAATAAAAAETPKVSSNSFTSCEASSRVMLFKNSITSSRVAAMIAFLSSSKGSFVAVCLYDSQQENPRDSFKLLHRNWKNRPKRLRSQFLSEIGDLRSQISNLRSWCDLTYRRPFSASGLCLLFKFQI